MVGTEAKIWIRRGTVGATVTVIVVLFGVTWYFSNVIRDDLLTPEVFDPDKDLEVLGVGSGRISLTRTALSEQEGVWGLVGDQGYGQVSRVIQVRDGEVERSFRTLDGRFEAGDRARMDQYAFFGDPATAHGITFEELLVPGELGLYPAWFVDGDKDTWVVFVHGKGLDERRQALRILPALAEEGYPVLVISYRNDLGGPANDDGVYRWGLEEWRDLEAAIRFASTKGAESFVIIAYSMGASITSMYLHEAMADVDVKGVIFDSPVLDLGGVVSFGANGRGVPGPLTALARTVAGLRFGIEWDELDQVEQAAAFDLPILVMHGTGDETVPVVASESFAAARPDIVEFVAFDGVDHLYLWNSDPERYESIVIGFLDSVAAQEDA